MTVLADALPRPSASPALAPAFAASLAVHAALLLALISWVAVGDRAQFPSRDTLAVLLVGATNPTPIESSPTEESISVPVQEAPRLAGTDAPMEVQKADPPSTTNNVIAAVAPPAAAPPASRVVSLGAVDVRLLESDLLTNLHPVHGSRVASEFPAEVARGVRMDWKPEIKYPEDALAAQRQGTVLAFIIVDAAGAVEEISIVEGAPEFAQPVQDALLATHFRPAEDRGTPIRFYTMLRFDFVPNRPGAVPAEDARAKPSAAPEDARARPGAVPAEDARAKPGAN